MKNKAPFDCTASRPIPGQLDSLCGHLGFFNMKEVQLTRGQVALVDDEDFEYLNQWKWYAGVAGKNKKVYYAIRNVYFKNHLKRHTIILKMHREIMNIRGEYVTDHINHNTLDNRKCNLRKCTRRENAMNLEKPNKLKSMGVEKKCKKYRARIKINNKNIHVGTYKTLNEAHLAYLNAAQKLIRPPNRHNHNNRQMKTKTYKFKDQKVIAVPETYYCDGCIFDIKNDCQMSTGNALDQGKVQKANGMPDCLDNKIIFKPAP